jgi:thymidine phosphorylase
VHLLGVDEAEASRRVERALAGGEALEVFGRMIEAQGGDRRVVDDPWSVLPRAPIRRPLLADRDGVLAAVQAEEIGRAAADLGAGRHRKGDSIDPATGIVFGVRIGDRVDAGDEIGAIHARDEGAAAGAAARVLAALTFVDHVFDEPQLVYGWRDARVAGAPA